MGIPFIRMESHAFFPSENNSKKYIDNIKKKFFRTKKPVSIKFGTKHLLVKGIQICINKGPYPFPGGDNSEIAKNIMSSFKNHLITKPIGRFLLIFAQSIHG